MKPTKPLMSITVGPFENTKDLLRFQKAFKTKGHIIISPNTRIEFPKPHRKGVEL